MGKFPKKVQSSGAGGIATATMASIALMWIEDSKWLNPDEQRELIDLLKSSHGSLANPLLALLVVADMAALDFPKVQRDKKATTGPRSLGRRLYHPSDARAARKLIKSIARNDRAAIVSASAHFVDRDPPEYQRVMNHRKWAARPRKRSAIVESVLRELDDGSLKPKELIRLILPVVLVRFQAEGVKLADGQTKNLSGKFLYAHIEKWRSGLANFPKS